MTHELKPLPYALDALEPMISKQTLEHHYLKHHKAYVEKLNKLILNTQYADLELEETVFESFESQKSNKQDKKIFNNAAQVWNHTFYWSCMNPNRLAPSAVVTEAFSKEFGSMDMFYEKFTQAGMDLFGSGWVWVTKDESGKLAIISKENAENPITDGVQPILVCDVWEHAYYLDRQEKRADYLGQFRQLIDWKFIERNLVEDSFSKMTGLKKKVLAEPTLRN
jgi:Fe-Mn family superoxide dismutase